MNANNLNILILISKGMADKEIAKELNIKIKTVNQAIHRMLKKHKCKNRTDLVVTILPTVTENKN
jgi:DNA-binding NarL/FixJ family response regulator